MKLSHLIINAIAMLIICAGVLFLSVPNVANAAPICENTKLKIYCSESCNCDTEVCGGEGKCTAVPN
jgi:hypothetical protein